MGGGSRRQLSEGCMFVSARGTLMIDFMVHYSRFGPDEKNIAPIDFPDTFLTPSGRWSGQLVLCL